MNELVDEKDFAECIEILKKDFFLNVSMDLLIDSVKKEEKNAR